MGKLRAALLLAVASVAWAQYTPPSAQGGTPGNVTGPGSSTVGHNACWGNGGGTSLTDCGAPSTPRSIGPSFAYSLEGTAATTLGAYLTGSNSAYRSLLINSYCSHVIDEYGVNDLGTGSSVAIFRASLAALYPSLKVIGTTLEPVTTSTDSWATTTNQTGTASNAQVTAFNALERAGIAGEIFSFDINSAIDVQQAGVWSVAINPYTATGTANLMTTDGIHENAIANQLIHTRGVINVNAIQR